MDNPMPYFAFALALSAQWWAAYAEFLRKVTYSPTRGGVKSEAEAP